MADWTAARYQELHDRLEVEIADLRAVVAAEVELEVTRALTGIVPPRYRPPYDERTRLRPLPADHPLARRRPWTVDQLTPNLDELLRRSGERWWAA